MISIDMEMPQNCEQCRFSILQRDDVYCTAMTGTTLLYEDNWHLKRVDRCPLSPLTNENLENEPSLDEWTAHEYPRE
jgi:hypothetical protein